MISTTEVILVLHKPLKLNCNYLYLQIILVYTLLALKPENLMRFFLLKYKAKFL